MFALGSSRATAFAGVSRPAAIGRAFVPSIEAAHKKGAGSTKNGRDSNAQRRGVKVLGAQPVRAGGIIIRQVGSQVCASASQLSHARGEGASGKKICNFFIIINAEKFSLCDFI